MNAKWKIFGLTTAIVCIAAAILLSRQPTPQVAIPKPQSENPAVQLAKAPPAPETAPPEETFAPAVQPAKKSAIQSTPKPQTPSAKPPKEPLHDPDARDALALVGLDPQAEQYWLDAIFDSSLPDNEREDLMEDLNETGFADPKNLTANDLPLIVNRLRLIEELEPNVDPFMRDHLGEAYKDLSKMYATVTGH